MKLTGKIISGKTRGRELGIPTINLDIHTDALEHGVYAVRTKIGDRHFNGVMNFGSRPTFKDDEVVMEVHLFEFDGDVYG
jgi:riboflavin kinase/FMN adenylyltransferase